MSAPLGRTQRLFVGVLLFPFFVASAALFTGKMSSAEWAAMMQFLGVTVAVPFFGFGQAGKIFGKDPPATPTPPPVGAAPTPEPTP